MGIFSDTHRDSISNIDDLFKLSTPILDKLITEGATSKAASKPKTVSQKLFAGTGEASSSVIPKLPSGGVSLSEGLISTQPGRAKKTGKTSAVGSVDPRVVEAAWFKRLEKVRNAAAATAFSKGI